MNPEEIRELKELTEARDYCEDKEFLDDLFDLCCRKIDELAKQIGLRLINDERRKENFE